MTKNIMIVGVGGQGTLLASKLLGNALLDSGFDVKVSEVHGMSQRGGSVVTYVKYGEEVFSPVICEGEADLILAFEELEAARWLPYLKKDGTMIVNTQKINPMPVITGAATYPDSIVEKLSERGIRIKSVDALALAKQAGNAKAVNVVLMGIVAKNMDITKDIWERALKETVPEKFYDENAAAFQSGYGL